MMNIQQEHPQQEDTEMTNRDPNTNDEPKTVSPLLVIFGITGIVGVMVALMLIFTEPRQPAQDTVRPIPTTPSPPRPLNDWRAQDFALQDLDGNTVRLSDFSGRVVFLNMWHTACEPCVREMPAFDQFMREQGDDGAVVLAVNQLAQTEADIRPFLDRLGVSRLIVLLDPDFLMTDLYPYNFFPTTYVIDPQGMVRFFKVGELDLAQMRLWAEQLEG
ncbi:MAG: hypothetical protein CUN52_03715 [Phototrophicales bacterium]|nr:MAG: hypothetical protein CUN52_03715 [Phototrophicales bacterium]